MIRLIYTFLDPAVGKKEIAPIDIVLAFGITDTTNDGKYQFPLDTALNRFGQKIVVVPFKAYNLKTISNLKLLVLENSNSFNNKWDPGEGIVVLTPPPYNTGATSTHCQINNSPPGGTAPLLPNLGDSIFFLLADLLQTKTYSSSQPNVTTLLLRSV